MRFLLDQGLPRSTVAHLQTKAIEAEHVGDLGLARASDETILTESRNRGAVVVTLDSDFHETISMENSVQNRSVCACFLTMFTART